MKITEEEAKKKRCLFSILIETEEMCSGSECNLVWVWDDPKEYKNRKGHCGLTREDDLSRGSLED